ncbi:IS66 family insertion sequence element accessory protein TnpB [Pseudomonas syringae]|uniref:IS66 family insertion sequence element accessory protein TnpB n=1 Tax=Pseudomonas syringae TaxID=317 RepID=UPI001267EE0A|nr:hypothetical protein [Pseudomonas syringae]MCF5211100.1 hypothetical protein [Pseudomonas syringae]MCF5216620.1 hypothetical protein [Pseudomonas syringae]MCF5221809.1 hypothetical protein [Pseudomonas syringae]MCF5268507.1 hypothetical protein [Pseudomonas syringae]
MHPKIFSTGCRFASNPNYPIQSRTARGPHAPQAHLLVHDGFGIWLAARRLNQGKFHWPGVRHGSEMELDTEQLQALVLGLPWRRAGSGGSITLL